MIYGYARVSTGEQNLDLQLDALKGAGCERIFQDDGISGTMVERPGLDEAQAVLDAGDQLIVWSLDRLGRSMQHLVNLVTGLGKRGVGFRSLTEAMDTNTAGGEFIFHIMGAMAQFERRMIAERCKAGREAAKRRGRHMGRPHALTPDQLTMAKRMIGDGSETVSGMASMLSVHRVTLHRALKRVACQAT